MQFCSLLCVSVLCQWW